jgi:Ni/Co efflux regulator RcnB
MAYTGCKTKEFPMKRLLLTTSIAALLLTSASAFAQPDQHKHKHKDKAHGPPAHAIQHDRDYGHHDNGRHLGWQKQQWKRGARLPVVYLQPRYYITDYQAYRLAPPPPGYGWVRPYPDTNEYLMVQLATGLISQVLGY